jgi:hypothetical protein
MGQVQLRCLSMTLRQIKKLIEDFSKREAKIVVGASPWWHCLALRSPVNLGRATAKQQEVDWVAQLQAFTHMGSTSASVV